MPIKKYRDVSDMPDIWHEPGSPELFRAIRSTWEFSRRTTRPSYPPGVYKFRTIEEAEAQRELFERRNFEAHRRRLEGRRPKPRQASEPLDDQGS